MSEKKTCCTKVYGPGYFRGRCCGKTAKIERNGEWYCGTHDPVRVEERRKERREAGHARWDAEQAARKAKEAAAAEQKRRSDCYDDLLAALEWALPNLNREPYEWTDEDDATAHEAALSAIAKAQGEAE
jgi:hypothetical protein